MAEEASSGDPSNVLAKFFSEVATLCHNTSMLLEAARVPRPGRPSLKKKRKRSNPSGIKRPLTAYMLFCQDNRDRIRAEDPTIKPHDMARRLGDLWKTLPDDERSEYLRKQDEARSSYEKLRKIAEETHYEDEAAHQDYGAGAHSGMHGIPTAAAAGPISAVMQGVASLAASAANATGGGRAGSGLGGAGAAGTGVEDDGSADMSETAPSTAGVPAAATRGGNRGDVTASGRPSRKRSDA